MAWKMKGDVDGLVQEGTNSSVLQLSCINQSMCNTQHIGTCVPEAGPRLNIKTVLSTYGDFHVKDKTAVRTSYL